MTGNEYELTEYLQRLLEHAKECDLEGCAPCLTVHGILELIKNRLFSSLVYPEVTISAAASKPGWRQAASR
jgi:hypothetical protein